MGTEQSIEAPSIPSSDGLQRHYILKDNLLKPPFPKHVETMYFGAGCFWGTEKGYWRLPGVYSTAVGFQAGRRANPGYYDVCSGSTGHNEVTQVVFDPKKISIADLLHRFFDCHDPTQGDGQGNDRGTQYRSGIYCTTEEQVAVAIASRAAYNEAMIRSKGKKVTTEIIGPGFHNEDRFNSCVETQTKYPQFYYAEDYHQQYAAIPGNRQYCSAEPTGVKVPAYETWDIKDTAVKSKHSPFLPDKFWKSFKGSISAPNKPHIWNVDVAKNVDKEAENLHAEFSFQEKRLQRECDVIIRYCGGCGFQSKADELKSLILSSSTPISGDKIGLLQEVSTTGNLDLSVKASDEKFVLIHSKKEKGHGFVDSDIKKERIIKALSVIGNEIELNLIASSGTGSPDTLDIPSSVSSVNELVEKLISSNTVMVFSKSYCPFCMKAKKQFQDLGIDIKVVELDLDSTSNGEAIQEYLKDKTGISTVPIVYVKGALVGDSSQTVAAREAGDFDHLKAE